MISLMTEYQNEMQYLYDLINDRKYKYCHLAGILVVHV